MKELRRHLPDVDAAVGLSHLRRRRSRRRQGRRQPLAGGIRPVPARVRGRSGRRLAQRDRAPPSAAPEASAESTSRTVPRWKARTPTLRCRRTSTPSPPIPTLRRCAYQSRTAAARNRALRAGRARLSRCDRGLRRRSRCCSTTSACCSTTWVARTTRWKPTKRRCAATLTLADCHYNLALLYEDAEEAEGSHPAHGAVSPADRD